MSIRAWHQHLMGTEVSIHIVCADTSGPAHQAACGTPADSPAVSIDAAVAGTFAAIAQTEQIFSPFIADSEVSRIRRGELELTAASPVVRQVSRACTQLELTSEGRFTAWFDGAFNPTGYVKGWAVEAAANTHLAGLLDRADITAVGINAGGDMRLYTAAGADWTWTVGIADPTRPGEVIATVEVTNGAVATSGTAERGSHIVNPLTGAAADGVLSATVIADTLTDADVWATVAAVAGADQSWLGASPVLSGVTVGPDGQASVWSRDEVLVSAPSAG